MKRQSRQTKPKSTDESPTRGRPTKTSPSRSPGRPRITPKSPKSKSPSRKSPSRKSPSRKSPSRAEQPTLRSPSSRSIKKSIADVIDTANSKPIIKVVKLTSKEYETKNGIESNDIHSRLRERRPKLEYYLPPKSTRSKDDNYEKLLQLAHTTELPKSEISNDKLDNDLSEDDTVYKLPEPRKLITPIKELKSKISSSRKLLFIVYAMMAPILAVSFPLLCNNQPCKFTTLPNLKPYLKIGSWFTLRSLWLTLGFTATVFLFSFFPYCGKEATLPGSKRPYVANGFFLFVLVLTTALCMEKYCISISDIVHEDYIQLCLLWIIASFLFGVVLFFKGRYSTNENKNPRADGENRLYEFFVGREISPFTGKIHYKVCFFRIGLISMTLFNFLWLYRSLKVGVLPTLTTESLMNSTTYIDLMHAFEINTTLAVFSFVQILYGLYFLYFEQDSSYMYEFMCEGVGFYFIFVYFIYPFTTPLITKLILDQNVHISNVILAFVLTVYLLGFYINSASNSQKNLFRKNPLHPKVAHLQTLPTLNGNRLIISGWWGFVRHPNYMGDLISQSMLLFATYNNILLFLVIVQLIYLVHRAVRDGKRCSERYGVAWKRYCQKVPYTLIPKVW